MSTVVKYKSVSVTVYPWTHPSGRQYWRFKKQGKAVTRASEEAAKREALAYARTLYRGHVSLNELSPDQLLTVKQFLELTPTLSDVRAFAEWRKRHRPRVPLSFAQADFLAAKSTTAGHYHRRNLTRYLSLLDPLADRPMSEICITDLRAILPEAAPRTLSNIRQTWVTFWRWAARNGMTDKDSADLPALLDLPPVVHGIPAIYTADELRVMLSNVSAPYLPWLACAAFLGIRTEEIAPIKHSDKPPLDWSDFHWDRGLVIVRPSTSKTGRRRVIPILPALDAWLRPIAKESGRMAPRIPPSAGEGRAMAETTRLGKLIGGWKRNALRHSWITFRAALVGISQAAGEAGNSESEARRSYVDAAGKDQAEAWFAVFPS
jgi:integrase